MDHDQGVNDFKKSLKLHCIKCAPMFLINSFRAVFYSFVFEMESVFKKRASSCKSKMQIDRWSIYSEKVSRIRVVQYTRVCYVKHRSVNPDCVEKMMNKGLHINDEVWRRFRFNLNEIILTQKQDNKYLKLINIQNTVNILFHFYISCYTRWFASKQISVSSDKNQEKRNVTFDTHVFL